MSRTGWRSTARSRRRLRLAAGLTAVAIVAAAANPHEAPAAACPSQNAEPARVDHFDAQRAWRIVERQLAYSQRPAGSAQLRRLARTLHPLLPNGRFERLPGEPGLRNVVGTLPGQEPGILVGAHYDTLVEPPGFVGANNGAAGTAVVIDRTAAMLLLDYVGNRGLRLPREGRLDTGAVGSRARSGTSCWRRPLLSRRDQRQHRGRSHALPPRRRAGR